MFGVWAVSSEEGDASDNRMSASPSPNPGDLPDGGSELLARMAGRDRQAFAVFYDRFSKPLYAVALRILRDARESEDVVQEVFLTLWEKADTFAPERGSAFSWAVALTRNRAIDRIRMRHRRSELLAARSPEELGYETNAAADSADDLWLKEKAFTVRTAVAALPSDQQRALELAFFSGLTQQQIADTLNEPLGTVKARIRRGLLKLRETLSRRL
jgi:RNA polymerase sigma-70 factor (ECF subfamily)